jgi:hypothetical protein
MKRELLEQHLADTERRLVEIGERILQQSQAIAELKRTWQPTTVARSVLETLLQKRAQHEGTRERLRKELGLVIRCGKNKEARSPVKGSEIEQS